MQLYKPNPKSLNGNAVGFSINSKSGKLYVELVKQSGPDPTPFKGGKKINVSFNISEVGAILNVIERGIPFKTFHKSEKGSCGIEAKTYIKKADESKDGITLNVRPNGSEDSFGFWFNNAESRMLRSYLEFFLEKAFSSLYSDQKKAAEERLKNKKSAPKQEEPPEPENNEVQEEEEEEDPFA